MNTNKTIPVDSFYSNYPTKEIAKNTLFIKPDDSVHYVYYLAKGYIRSYIVTEYGQEFTVNIYNQGSYLPTSLILSGRDKSPYYFQTLTPTSVHVIPSQELLANLSQNSDLSYALLKRFASGLEGFVERLRAVVHSSAQETVSSTLYLLGAKYGIEQKDGSVLIGFPHTHESLATLSGLSRETTSIEVKKLEKQGIIMRKNKQTWIMGFNKLRGFAATV